MTAVDPRTAALTEVVEGTLASLRGGLHHLPPVTESVLADKLVEMLTPLLLEQRAFAVAEVVGALAAKGTELSELAEEEMRPSLEERAQTWYEAAAVAEKLTQRKTESPRG